MPLPHLLTTKARIYDAKKDGTGAPADCEYDEAAGAWRCGPEWAFLVKTVDAGCRIPGTKKEDRETGEDQKGE